MKNLIFNFRSCFLGSLILLSLLIVSCAEGQKSGDFINSSKRSVSEDTKAYWYDGKAELSSYKLTQSRYGELHEGTAVLVYVTEPFSTKYNTKADEHRKDNVPVLKLNTTKKFTTGIYPYSMMNSTFYPFEKTNVSLKITSSLQEWCGMTFIEMKTRKNLEFSFNSYFEGFSFKNKKLKKTLLEDDLWSLIRLNPELLPIGINEVIPSMFFLRMRNKDVVSYKVSVTKTEKDNGKTEYVLIFPELERTLAIQFATAFPHEIIGWEDTHYSGYGKDKKILTTTAERIKTLKSDYWNQNLNEHKGMRSRLGLE